MLNNVIVKGHVGYCILILTHVMVQIASKSTLLPRSPVDVVCSTLLGNFCPDKLVDSYSKCISFSAGGGSIMTLVIKNDGQVMLWQKNKEDYSL